MGVGWGGVWPVANLSSGIWSNDLWFGSPLFHHSASTSSTYWHLDLDNSTRISMTTMVLKVSDLLAMFKWMSGRALDWQIREFLLDEIPNERNLLPLENNSSNIFQHFDHSLYWSSCWLLELEFYFCKHAAFSYKPNLSRYWSKCLPLFWNFGWLSHKSSPNQILLIADVFVAEYLFGKAQVTGSPRWQFQKTPLLH